MICFKLAHLFLIMTLSLLGLTVHAGYETQFETEVVNELTTQFAPFKAINMDQYLALKHGKNAKLLEAQRNLYQYLQSTSIKMMPGPKEATGSWIEILDSRQQVFDNPAIVQTGLEILSREILKNEEAQCPTIINTIRFISGGIKQRGHQVPGLDYRRNQLLILHMLAAYSDDQYKNILPCQDVISDLTKRFPELKNQTFPNCPTCTPGKFFDRETRFSMMVLAKSFLYWMPQKNFNLWGAKSGFGGYMESLHLPVYINPPGEDRGWEEDFFIQIKGPFDAKAFVNVKDPDTVYGGIPERDSMQVMEMYAELAAE